MWQRGGRQIPPLFLRLEKCYIWVDQRDTVKIIAFNCIYVLTYSDRRMTLHMLNSNPPLITHNMKKSLITCSLIASSACLSAQTTTLYVDFQHDGGADATGYTVASSGLGILTSFTDPGSFDLGNGYGLSFTGDYTTFSGEQADNPVDEDGWELTGTQFGTFTLTGLSAGDQVTMYATNAWDDFGVFNSVVSQISFGGGSLVDVLAGNYPGINLPQDAEVSNTNDLFGDSQNTNLFTAIASSVVATGSSLSGVIDSSTSPGQFGAFIFEVTPIPEPSSYALLTSCLALGSVMIRRRRS